MNTPYRRSEVRLGEPDYPSCLLDLADPPKILYVTGDPAHLRLGLAVIGARRATPYGLGCASRFAGWAAASGVCVISGAAIGCDQAAHRAARAVPAPTVAVLGCGADIDYPSGAMSLLADLRSHCAVVSELPWGTHPTRWAFSRRNRIIAALSAAVLVVEAGLPSGTFSTADHALAIGRDVLAIPGSVNAPECRGPNRLIRQGAMPITDASELADALEGAGLLLDRSTPDATEHSGRLCVIERAVRTDPMRPDDLARALTQDVVSVVRILGELELRNRVVRFRDGRYGVPEPTVRRR